MPASSRSPYERGVSHQHRVVQLVDVGHRIGGRDDVRVDASLDEQGCDVGAGPAHGEPQRRPRDGSTGVEQGADQRERTCLLIACLRWPLVGRAPNVSSSSTIGERSKLSARPRQ